MNSLKFLAVATIGLVVMVSMTDDKMEEETYTLRDMEPVSSTDPPCIQMYYYIEQYADSFNIPKPTHTNGDRTPNRFPRSLNKTSGATPQNPERIALQPAQLS